jgi:putative intracellular protease/amidase
VSADGDPVQAGRQAPAERDAAAAGRGRREKDRDGCLESGDVADDDSRYSADDLLSLGFLSSPQHLRLVEQSMPIAELDVADHDAVLFVGGQGPMVTFYDDERVHRLAAAFFDAGKLTCVICHAACLLLKARRADGTLIVAGKTWTGFANSEEDYVDQYVGRTV